MSLNFDPIAARQRHQDMLQEAANIRLAKQVAKANGAESLLSRMVKLLSRSSRLSQTSGRSSGTLAQGQLADANNR